jgi:hypothetical protein
MSVGVADRLGEARTDDGGSDLVPAEGGSDTLPGQRIQHWKMALRSDGRRHGVWGGARRENGAAGWRRQRGPEAALVASGRWGSGLALRMTGALGGFKLEAKNGRGREWGTGSARGRGRRGAWRPTRRVAGGGGRAREGDGGPDGRKQGRRRSC